MPPIPDPTLAADQMFMAERILTAFSSGVIPMHPSRYSELSRWAAESFRALESSSLRKLRDVAPFEIREVIENVLHERRVVSWAVNDLAGLRALAECSALLRRCRTRASLRSHSATKRVGPHAPEAADLAASPDSKPAAK